MPYSSFQLCGLVLFRRVPEGSHGQFVSSLPLVHQLHTALPSQCTSPLSNDWSGSIQHQDECLSEYLSLELLAQALQRDYNIGLKNQMLHSTVATYGDCAVAAVVFYIRL